ncbi:UNVERIFIED_CONTAM: NAC domain-containing protein 60 [Sesamum calycinum]|uniref:NAC domain-containing protein 60 n=1 Tax=Sesamum calycinum TaxID=2727403 RepID=A0AAW2SC38_9LAMI
MSHVDVDGSRRKEELHTNNNGRDFFCSTTSESVLYFANNTSLNQETYSETSVFYVSGFPVFSDRRGADSVLPEEEASGSDEGVEVIPEVDICRHEPWDLPAQAIIQSDNEWFFFSPRGRKYPNGSQSKRATESGYWKATGKERSVKSGSNVIGTKRTLVFHTGRAPKGQRTEWIMHEYCTSEKSQDAMVVCRLRKNSEFHLNDNLKKNSIKDLPAVNNSMTGLSCGEQSGMVDGAKPVDSCSKDCTSSYNSHSVEQVDTGAESDDKQPSDFSQDGCSSLKKDCADEEDCYADIMKDDIVKLDEHPGLSPVPVVKPKSELRNNQATVSLLPFQGTANRRLRLRRHRIESYQEGQMEIYKFVKQNIPIEGGPDSDTWQRPESLIHNFTTKKDQISILPASLNVNLDDTISVLHRGIPG